jgi:hypothetical protein
VDANVEANVEAMRALVRADLEEGEREGRNFLYAQIFAHDVLERFARENGRSYRRPNAA